MLLALDKKSELWVPLPGPQTIAYHCSADEIYYGGAAGGGKTDLLLGLAMTAHQKSVIFRREYTQLKDLEFRMREIYGQRGRYNSQDKVLVLEDGRRLDLGAVKHEDDKQKWKGRPHDFKGFDEIPDFTESQYLFLTAWARTTDPNQRVRVVAVGNPPMTPEGEWVIRRWAPWLDKKHPNPAAPSEVRWFAMVDGEEVEVGSDDPIEHNGVVINPKSRTFIPAALEDNPFLIATDYGTQIDGLPEPLRSILQGNFYVARQDQPFQVIPTEWIVLAQERWRQTEQPGGHLTALGCDPSRGGEDATVLAKRYDNWIAPLVIRPGREMKDGPAVATLVIDEHEGEALINVDVIGIGSSVYDTLLGSGMENTYPVNFASKSSMRDKTRRLKMRNKRAEGYWKLREMLDPEHGEDLCLPPDQELLADLSAPQYKVTVSGILIEDKEEIKKRIGRSPDKGDAVVLSIMNDDVWTVW